MRTKTTPESTVAPAFERRATRALSLAATSSAAEALRFAAWLCRAQGRLSAELARVHARSPLSGRLSIDLERVSEGVHDLLRSARKDGPELLAQEAARWLDEPPARTRERLLSWWNDERQDFDYLSREILRPYLEVLASLATAPDRPLRGDGCPFCGGPWWIAVRSAESGAAGARRLLGCACCGRQWPTHRGRCPRCAEEAPDRLPAFSSDRHPAARIDACETCRGYLKSIDLAVDVSAVPEVDDLASLSMDLWAQVEGFERLEPGLAGCHAA